MRGDTSKIDVSIERTKGEERHLNMEDVIDWSETVVRFTTCLKGDIAKTDQYMSQHRSTIFEKQYLNGAVSTGVSASHNLRIFQDLSLIHI